MTWNPVPGYVTFHLVLIILLEVWYDKMAYEQSLIDICTALSLLQFLWRIVKVVEIMVGSSGIDYRLA